MRQYSSSAGKAGKSRSDAPQTQHTRRRIVRLVTNYIPIANVSRSNDGVSVFFLLLLLSVLRAVLEMARLYRGGVI